MRVVWRSLFWVGDGGWHRDDLLDLHVSANETSRIDPYNLSAIHAAMKLTKAENRTFEIPIPNLYRPLSQRQNISTLDSAPWTFLRRFFLGDAYLAQTYNSVPAANATQQNSTLDYLGPRSPSLLSDVSFFHWFPSQAANRFLIDVLEGQIITLLVVVAFILIFLIREWVVQQQPVINMVALGEDAAAVVADQLPENEENEQNDEEPVNVAQVEEETRAIAPNEDETETVERHPSDTPPRTPNRPRRSSSTLRKERDVMRKLEESVEIPQELREALRHGTPDDIVRVMGVMPAEESVKLSDALVRLDAEVQETEEETSQSRGQAFPQRISSLSHSQTGEYAPVDAHSPSSSSSQRPHMPARDRSSIATEIQRRLEEEDHSWSFTNIPEIQRRDANQSSNSLVPETWEDGLLDDISERRVVHTSTTVQEQGSDHSGESWQRIPDALVDAHDQDTSRDKGKAPIRDNGSDRSHNAAAAPSDTDATSEPSHGAEPTIDADARGDEPQPDGDDDGYVLEEVAAPEPALDQEREQGPELPVHAPQPARLVDRVLDWVFDGVAPGMQADEDGANDEQVIRELADEAPFVAFANNEPREPANIPVQDPEVAAAAAQAGIDVNDQDAIDDAEDLDGIMELIGMQGPLTGLFQNAMFSAVLISATLACAVWLPYLGGKVVILFMGSPVALFVKLPLQIVATLADLLVDGVLFVVAGAVYWTFETVRLFLRHCSLGLLNQSVARPVELVTGPSYTIAASAADRLGNVLQQSPLLPPPTYLRLSINSHVALRSIQNTTSYTLNNTRAIVTAFLEDASGASTSATAARLFSRVPELLGTGFTALYRKSTTLLSWLLTTRSYKITFNLDFGNDVAAPVVVEQWTANDRLIAVFAGYAYFAMAGAVYLKRGAPLSTSRQGQRIERIISEILQQAGGVLKVILIISIEMLVFPLYCGLLLDVALLPLFENATLATRWHFSQESPWTSGFVHWFIGTCYMFHFALFVSMCRKIMRKGVLYFIRDPDDPQFHPVRDVLERSVTTQLRKIAFSALVYGALVIVCLGGVVWGLSRITTNVLPIHWVSHAPSLEFPLDLLFYNFLTPVIIRLYKPSDGLHAMSQWWFQHCARFLRLSNFLFGDKAKDQEGRRLNGGIAFEGRYVRAPASDQVRIPKGEPVFVEVDANNVRKDGKNTGGGVHNSNMVTVVYIPPWFRVRIALFVFTIWVFAAVAGVSATIIPLVFGRYLFTLVLPSHVEMNDIHSFSLGVYSLGSIGYTLYQAYKFLRGINRPATSTLTTLYNMAATASRIGLRILRFTYVWASLVLVIPFLFAVLVELYFLMPLHAYIGPAEPHVVHLIQDWTLGFLYARLAARMIFSHPASRPARAFSAVIQQGYLKPNAKIATRCFLLPALTLFLIALTVPSIFAASMNLTVYKDADPVTRSQVWRFSFPAVGCAVGAVWAAREGLSVLQRWRMVVRDEVYLIGERLHNFGDRRIPVTAGVSSTIQETAGLVPAGDAVVSDGAPPIAG